MKLEDICKLHTLAEAKLVLIMMTLKGLKRGTLEQVADLTGLSIPEVSQGAHMLKIHVPCLNFSRDFNNVIIDKAFL